MNTTSITLLERLRSADDEEAWTRFVKLYTPLLYYWCRRVGLKEPDAADLVQDVLAHLLRKLPQFHYETGGSFRAWLRIVTINKWRERQRRRALPGALQEYQLQAIPDESHDWVLEETEYRQHLIRSGLSLIQPEFSPVTWQAFQSHVMQGKTAAAVAAELGIRIGTVYAAKSRVLARLRSEIAQFLDDEI